MPGRALETAVTEPGEGSPVVDSPCASGCGMESASGLYAQKLAGRVALSKDLDLLGSERLNHEAINPELKPSSVERRSQSPRRSAPDVSSSTAASSADACGRGHAAEQQGRVGAPSSAELVEVLRSMLCGDDATPQRSNSGWEVAPASTGLAVTVVGAVEALYKELGVPKGKSLMCTSGPVDREEAYGYLIADVMGSALLSATGARSVGERTRKRKEKIAAALPEAKKQAKKRAKREAQNAGLDADEAATKAAADKELELLGAPLELELPALPPPPLLKPRPSQKRPRPEPEQRSEFDMPSQEEQQDAINAAIAEAMAAANACLAAAASSDAAVSCVERAQSQLESSMERCEAEKNMGTDLDTLMGLQLQERVRRDTLDQECERAAQKLSVALADAEAASVAHGAAQRIFKEKREVAERMRAWLKCPDVLTPFPWPGDEYIFPCNWDDLDYFETSHRGYPPGVREFRERLYAHHRSIGLPLE
jgi:hypothetical protein